jgi:hypothetical protein
MKKAGMRAKEIFVTTQPPLDPAFLKTLLTCDVYPALGADGGQLEVPWLGGGIEDPFIAGFIPVYFAPRDRSRPDNGRFEAGLLYDDSARSADAGGYLHSIVKRTSYITGIPRNDGTITNPPTSFNQQRDQDVKSYPFISFDEISRCRTLLAPFRREYGSLCIAARDLLLRPSNSVQYLTEVEYSKRLNKVLTGFVAEKKVTMAMKKHLAARPAASAAAASSAPAHVASSATASASAGAVADVKQAPKPKPKPVISLPKVPARPADYVANFKDLMVTTHKECGAAPAGVAIPPILSNGGGGGGAAVAVRPVPKRKPDAAAGNAADKKHTATPNDPTDDDDAPKTKRRRLTRLSDSTDEITSAPADSDKPTPDSTLKGADSAPAPMDVDSKAGKSHSQAIDVEADSCPDDDDDDLLADLKHNAAENAAIAAAHAAVDAALGRSANVPFDTSSFLFTPNEVSRSLVSPLMIVPPVASAAAPAAPAPVPMDTSTDPPAAAAEPALEELDFEAFTTA